MPSLAASQVRHAIGVDFGTTNTVLAVADAEGNVAPVRLGHEQWTGESLRTALSFEPPSIPSAAPRIEAGEPAIQSYALDPREIRFLQSIKSHAASRNFTSTRVFHRPYRLEDLVAAYLGCVNRYAARELIASAERIIVGRPVRFAGSAPDERLAIERYRAAFCLLGVRELVFVLEPVAAAFSHLQNFERSATVLVADFGGGTTDFSLVRFQSSEGRFQVRPIGQCGIGIAGDTFDQRIIENVILPELGKGTTYSSMGRRFIIPASLYSGVSRWDRLSQFRGSREFRELAKLMKLADQPDRIGTLIRLVENDDGLQLHSAVSRAKMDLSARDGTQLALDALRPGFRREITRSDFEAWIASDLRRIGETLDETLRGAGVPPQAVDRVFMTGGTSFVPSVRRMMAERFGWDKLLGGGELVSVAQGLALIGRETDLSAWALPGSGYLRLPAEAVREPSDGDRDLPPSHRRP